MKGKVLQFLFERRKMIWYLILTNKISRIRETRSSTIHVDVPTSEHLPVNICRTAESGNLSAKIFTFHWPVPQITYMYP